MKIKQILAASIVLSSALIAPGFVHSAEKTKTTKAGSDKPADAEAQFQKARALLRGEGVAKDPEKAFALMKDAADAGNTEAIGGLGYFYAAGVAVPKNDGTALRLFREAADKGSAKAQLNFGNALLHGRGIEKNATEGLKYIEMAVAQKLPDAVHKLGEVYYFGLIDDKPDFAKAYPHLLASAEGGNAAAQNMVGVLYRDGFGTEADLSKSEMWFRKAAEQGVAKAQSNLGHLLKPDGEDSAKRVEALKWLFLAEQQDEPTSKKTLDQIRAVIIPNEMAQARMLALKMKNKGAALKAKTNAEED